MTKREWVELFQAMNGRDPLPQEFLEAKKNGEFQTETPQPESVSPSVAEVSSSELVSSEIEQSAEPTHIDSAVIDSSESEQLVPDDSEVVAATQLSTSTDEPVAEPSEAAFVASPQPPVEDHLADLTEKAKGFASFAADKAKVGAELATDMIKSGAQAAENFINEHQSHQTPAVNQSTESGQLPQQQVADYNRPTEGFELQKRGGWLNVILYIVLFVPSVIIALAFLIGSGDSIGAGAVLFLLLIVALADYIYLLPTFICHTGTKYVIFILNYFFAWTLIGWIVLLFWALNSNKDALREQELQYMMRKVSDKL